MQENTKGSLSRGLSSLEKHPCDEVYVIEPYQDPEYDHRHIVKDSQSLPFNDRDNNDFLTDSSYPNMTQIVNE
jgi:hypothetical protein